MGSLRKNQILQILDRLCLRLCSVHTSDIISGWLSDVLVRPDRITTLKKLLYNICALQNKLRYQNKTHHRTVHKDSRQITDVRFDFPRWSLMSAGQSLHILL